MPVPNISETTTVSSRTRLPSTPSWRATPPHTPARTRSSRLRRSSPRVAIPTSWLTRSIPSVGPGPAQVDEQGDPERDREQAGEERDGPDDGGGHGAALRFAGSLSSGGAEGADRRASLSTRDQLCADNQLMRPAPRLLALASATGLATGSVAPWMSGSPRPN